MEKERFKNFLMFNFYFLGIRVVFEMNRKIESICKFSGFYYYIVVVVLIMFLR